MLNGTLALHDVRDVEAFARRALRTWLTDHSAYLRSVEHDDLLRYLIGEAWLLGREYDPQLGSSFSKYAFRLLQLRVAGWLRERYYDKRYYGELTFVSMEQLTERLEYDNFRENEWCARLVDWDQPERLLDDVDRQHRLGLLDERDRGIFELAAVTGVGGGMWGREPGVEMIAGHLGCSARTVRRRLRVAAAALRS